MLSEDGHANHEGGDDFEIQQQRAGGALDAFEAQEQQHRGKDSTGCDQGRKASRIFSSQPCFFVPRRAATARPTARNAPK